jgi:hypothetical protein
MESMNANGRSWVELSLRKGKEMLISSTFYLLLRVMVSITWMR